MAKEVDDPEVNEGLISSVADTPQGGVISPLLANIYPHRLDVEAERWGLKLVRYADDFVILTRTRTEARAVDRFVRDLLADIGLEVAESKSGVQRVSDRFEFLGFSFGRSLRPRPSALVRFKDTVRARTRRTAPISLAMMIEQLNPVLLGWGNYFAHGKVIRLFENLDIWVRDRLRSKVRGSKARFVSRLHLPNWRLDALGLVRLEELARARRLSPV